MSSSRARVIPSHRSPNLTQFQRFILLASGSVLEMRRHFWQKLKRYRNVSEDTFLDPKWQTKMTLSGTPSVVKFLREEAGDEVANEAISANSSNRITMYTKVSPYIQSRMDFTDLFKFEEKFNLLFL